MPKVTHVKKARKADKAHGIKKGDSYYWWKFRNGGRCVSKIYPKPSQLTRSEFWSTVYSLSEGETPSTKEAFIDDKADIITQLEELKDSCDDKFNNMPDSLQQGPTGVLLEERVSALDDAISEIEAVDEPDTEDENDPDATEAMIVEVKWQEIMDVLGSISCE